MTGEMWLMLYLGGVLGWLVGVPMGLWWQRDIRERLEGLRARTAAVESAGESTESATMSGVSPRRSLARIPGPDEPTMHREHSWPPPPPMPAAGDPENVAQALGTASHGPTPDEVPVEPGIGWEDPHEWRCDCGETVAHTPSEAVYLRVECGACGSRLSYVGPVNNTEPEG